MASSPFLPQDPRFPGTAPPTKAEAMALTPEEKLALLTELEATQVDYWQAAEDRQNMYSLHHAALMAYHAAEEEDEGLAEVEEIRLKKKVNEYTWFLACLNTRMRDIQQLIEFAEEEEEEEK